MKLSDFIPSGDTLKLIQGVEGKLLQRKRAENASVIVAAAAAIIQLLLEPITKDLKNIDVYVLNFFHFVTLIFQGDFDKALQFRPVYELTGLVIVVISLMLYLTLKRTKFLLRYSEEPFRYTFWIEAFKHVKDTEKEPYKYEEDDRFHYLLHHDLMEKLNVRIRRLSLLDLKNLTDDAKKSLTSHIHIEGHYTIRCLKDNECVLHMMPRIRIGPPYSPATLANQVKFRLEGFPGNATKLGLVDTNKYNNIFERIYSSIATEIYRQIKSDLNGKMDLFPTKYMRAVALFYEAEDFARSNTIDAYDQAIELYKEALRYFDLTEVKTISRAIMMCPILWGMEVKFQHMKARVQIGHAKCLIYRRQISALSGRYMNPLFEIRGELKEVVDNLLRLHNRMNPKRQVILPKGDELNDKEQEEIKKKNRLNTSLAFLTFPKDSWLRNLFWRSDQMRFERQNRLLFDAYLVSALAYFHLKAVQKANELLKDAKAVNPQLSERNALYLLTAGSIEPGIEKALPLFRQATEVAPDFQIAQYLLAYYSERRFRTQDEIEKGRAQSVIKEYEGVLEINPGNIAALSAQGYLHWLIKEKEEAKQKFNAGRDVKAMARQTFVGELNYGLARIAAEEGDFNTSYDRYTEAILADPGVGAYAVTTERIVTSYFDYIGPAILKRYESYKESVEDTISKIKEAGWKDEKGNTVSERTIDVVHSLVLNDYANACLNYYHRFGDLQRLKSAIEAYDQAWKIGPQNLSALYNLQNAYAWRNEKDDLNKGIECLKWVSEHGYPWPPAIIALVQSLLRNGKDEIRKIVQQIQSENYELKRIHKEYEEELKKKGFPWAPADLLGPKINLEGSKKLTGLRKDADNSISHLKGLLKEKEEKGKYIINEVFPHAKEIIKKTKLSTVYEGFEFNIDGLGIDILLSELKKMEKSRLDEQDIEAVRVWAEVISSNFQIIDSSSQDVVRTPQLAAMDLCNFIQKEYYPDNFDVNLILQDMYLYIVDSCQMESAMIESYKIEEELNREDKNKEIEKCKAKMKRCNDIISGTEKMKSYAEVIKPTITSWLDTDPVKYTSLKWLLTYFRDEPELISKRLYMAIENCQNETFQVYLDMFWNKIWEMVFYKIPGYEKSIKYYKDALKILSANKKLAPSVEVYYEKLGEAYEELENWGEAEGAYAEAIELESKPEQKAVLYNRIGKFFFRASRNQEAIPYYEKAITLDSNRPIYESNLGLTYSKLSKPNWDEMIKHCQRAVELRRKTPTDPYGLDYYYDFLAEAYFKAGRLKEFEKLFEASGDLKDEPEKKAVIYNRIGNLFFSEYKDKEAIPYYEKAIDLDNVRPIYESNLGLTYGNLGQWGRAIEHYTRAVELRRKIPTDPVGGLDYYYDFLAEAYFNTGRLKEFEELFEASGDLKDEPEKKAVIYNRIGNLFFRASRNQEAIPYYEKAITLDSNRPIYECNLGLTYSKLPIPNWNEMIKHCQRAIELRRKTPTDPVGGLDYYYDFLAEGYFKAGRLKEFEELFEASGDLKDEQEKKAVIYNRIGNLYFNEYKDKEAIPYYEKGIKFDSHRPIYECNLGRAYGNLGQWGKAIEHYTRALELRRKAPTDSYGLDYYYDYLAEGYFKAGRLKEFEELFEASGDLKDEPEKRAVIYNRIGNLLTQAKQDQEAIPYYKKATELAPHVAVYHANLGGAFRTLGLWEDTKEAYLKAVDLEPGNAEYQNRLGFIHYELGRFEESLTYYAKAIEINPDNAMYHANLGTTYGALGRWEEAKGASTKAVELDTQPVYECDLGRAYGNLGQWGKAIEHYTRALELRRKAPTDSYGLDYYYDYLAEGYFKAGRLKEFEELFEASGDLKDEPEKRAAVYNRIGNLYFGEFKNEESILYYKNAAGLAPHVAVYHANLTLAYTELGKTEDAEKACHEAIDIDPNNPVYQNDLGKAYEMNGDYQRAAEQYLKAIKLNPEANEYWSNLILACEHLLDLKKAIPLLESASKLIPDNAKVNQVLEGLKKIIEN